MAITATAATKISQGLKGCQMEAFVVEFNSTDATVEVTTDLVEIYGYCVGVAFGADAGHTEEDLGVLELDETYSSTNISITVVSGVITINRIPTAAAGTLADQRCSLILWGQG